MVHSAYHDDMHCVLNSISYTRYSTQVDIDLSTSKKFLNLQNSSLGGAMGVKTQQPNNHYCWDSIFTSNYETRVTPIPCSFSYKQQYLLDDANQCWPSSSGTSLSSSGDGACTVMTSPTVDPTTIIFDPGNTFSSRNVLSSFTNPIEIERTMHQLITHSGIGSSTKSGAKIGHVSGFCSRGGKHIAAN